MGLENDLRSMADLKELGDEYIEKLMEAAGLKGVNKQLVRKRILEDGAHTPKRAKTDGSGTGSSDTTSRRRQFTATASSGSATK